MAAVRSTARSSSRAAAEFKRVGITWRVSKLGALCGGSYKKDHSIFESIAGPPVYGKNPM